MFQSWIRRGALGFAIMMAASPALAQAQSARPPAGPAVPRPPVPPPAAAIPPLTPAQQAAALLGRWETCIDLAAEFLARSARTVDRAATNVERRCVEFEPQLRPVLAQSLREMMYGSSDEQVAEQTGIAVESLRRHIRARAVTAVSKARAK